MRRGRSPPPQREFRDSRKSRGAPPTRGGRHSGWDDRGGRGGPQPRGYPPRSPPRDYRDGRRGGPPPGRGEWDRGMDRDRDRFDPRHVRAPSRDCPRGAPTPDLNATATLGRPTVFLSPIAHPPAVLRRRRRSRNRLGQGRRPSARRPSRGARRHRQGRRRRRQVPGGRARRRRPRPARRRRRVHRADASGAATHRRARSGGGASALARGHLQLGADAVGMGRVRRRVSKRGYAPAQGRGRERGENGAGQGFPRGRAGGVWRFFFPKQPAGSIAAAWSVAAAAPRPQEPALAAEGVRTRRRREAEGPRSRSPPPRDRGPRPGPAEFDRGAAREFDSGWDRRGGFGGGDPELAMAPFDRPPRRDGSRDFDRPPRRDSRDRGHSLPEPSDAGPGHPTAEPSAPGGDRRRARRPAATRAAVRATDRRSVPSAPGSGGVSRTDLPGSWTTTPRAPSGWLTPAATTDLWWVPRGFR